VLWATGRPSPSCAGATQRVTKGSWFNSRSFYYVNGGESARVVHRSAKSTPRGPTPPVDSMPKDIQIKPAGNKSRFGHRGAKKRYSVFRAERNQFWLPHEEEDFKKLCEKHKLDQEQFFREDDNPNRKWSYALHRARKFLKDAGYQNADIYC
jgi:hypothetical protein